MGLLDDAIREHLELKRRRGADPTEIERAEREALGPVRRGPEPVDPDAYPAGTSLEEPVGYDAGHRLGWEDEPYDDERTHAGDLADAEEPYPTGGAADAGITLRPPGEERLPDAQPPIAEDPYGRRRVADDLAEDDLFDEPPPAGPHQTPHAGPVTSGEDTVEYTLEPEPEPDPHAEDVLEETPEFLQDAPEHDRLWFEQRPPKDFDFNE